MIDQPRAHLLLRAMADALQTDVIVGEDERAAGYTARIVANLSRILAREAELGPAAEAATVADLEGLLQRSGTHGELVEAFDQALTDDDRPADRRAAYELLVDDVARRLAIARPEYQQQVWTESHP